VTDASVTEAYLKNIVKGYEAATTGIAVHPAGVVAVTVPVVVIISKSPAAYPEGTEQTGLVPVPGVPAPTKVIAVGSGATISLRPIEPAEFAFVTLRVAVLTVLSPGVACVSSTIKKPNDDAVLAAFIRVVVEAGAVHVLAPVFIPYILIIVVFGWLILIALVVALTEDAAVNAGTISKP